MVNLKKLFSRAQPAAESTPEQDAVRDSVFSTGGDRNRSKWTPLRRQQQALAQTFQRGIDNLKAYTPEGEAIEGVDYAMDEAYPDLTQAKLANARGGYIPIAQLEWFGAQGFIGWQMCGVLSQNWLIDKACGVPAQDAIRKGYDVTLNNGQKLNPDVLNDIRLYDKRVNINGQMKSYIKKGRTFGIRHALFNIEGIDYEAPFNPDGITPGSYRGITQIDPYWITPELDMNAAANVASPNFYEPTWWRVNGKRVHRTHFIITRVSDDLVDILKPSYYYGGIPIPQKIYERVYAAERTANEAPMLLLSKRMTVVKTDTTKAFGPDNKFNDVMEKRAEYRNNFGMDVFGTEDEVQQFETSLSELNETIMTQYVLVASAANMPVTKLMGTPPKGFDATGEYDEASYHEEVESIQAEIATPFLERHHLCMIRSYIAPKHGIDPKKLGTQVVWNPLDSYTTKELAEINKIKADTAAVYVTAGAIDGYDVRQSVINDPESGFNGLDPVVPGGPGDREAQQEQDKALEQPITAKATAKKEAMDGVGPAAGVMYQAGDRFLLMKRRDDAMFGGTWAFPAGTIEGDESPIEAAVREFAEETGKVISGAYPQTIYSDSSFTLFSYYGDEFVPMICNEHTAYVWAKASELPSPLHPGIADQIKSVYGGIIPA